MKICFLTSGHDPFDDRIFYHMARSLTEQKHFVIIISSITDRCEHIDGIKINSFEGYALPKKEKIIEFIRRLKESGPDIIICSEPLPVYAAQKYSSIEQKEIRIIYDITEIYPLNSHLTIYHPLIRWFIFIRLFMFNIWVSKYADAFIFGEWYKSMLYRFFYPFKPFIFIPYYPDPALIRMIPPQLSEGQIRLIYTGRINLNRGYREFCYVIKKLSREKPELIIKVTIIGDFETELDRNNCEKSLSTNNSNIILKIIERQSFITFLELINQADIFIDLRSDSFLNHYNLPISLFLFIASGRPVIFSDLKAIRNHVDTSSFGFLVKPSDIASVVNLLEKYLCDKDLYYSHCRNARQAYELRYNWNILRGPFLTFIENH